MNGFVTKDEYEKTLRAYQKMQDEMKSDQRDKAEATGSRIRIYLVGGERSSFQQYVSMSVQ